MLKRAAQLFNGKDDTGQRGIERGGYAGCAACEDQAGNRAAPVQAQSLAEGVEHGSADVNRRPLSPDRTSYQQGAQGQAHARGGNGNRKQSGTQAPGWHFQGSDDLRYAAALGVFKPALCQIRQKREP
ncbi:hypothetical protein D3C78_401600 [compost metagenome]